MTRTSIVLTDQQIAAIRELVQKTGLGFSEIIRRAVDAYLQQQAAKK